MFLFYVSGDECWLELQPELPRRQRCHQHQRTRPHSAESARTCETRKAAPADSRLIATLHSLIRFRLRF